jgi:hypothetical protein
MASDRPSPGILIVLPVRFRLLIMLELLLDVVDVDVLSLSSLSSSARCFFRDLRSASRAALASPIATHAMNVI